MTKARSNAVANAAKGDLTVGNGTNLSGILAVGSNGDTLVADSSTSTGLRYQGSMAAGKNAIINGNFDIWQRGTSFASTAGFSADRWTNQADFANVTASQQTSGAPDGARYYLRMTSTADSSYWQNYQYMETATVSQFWGKTVVGSLKIRRNATNTANVLVLLQKSATVDAGSGATWTTIAQYTFTNATIPTGTTSADWLTATGTWAVPNDGTANSLRLTIQYNVVVASGSILELSQVQLELGSVPTAFTRAGGTIQGELAACCRYFQVLNGQQNQSWGSAGSATVIARYFFAAAGLRPITPTVTLVGTPQVYDGGSTINISSIGSIGSASQGGVHFNINVASGLSTFRPYTIYANAGEVQISAEL